MTTNQLFAGVDLGGTKIALVLHDGLTGQRLHELAAPTEAHDGPIHVLDRIAALVRQLCQEAGHDSGQLAGVGVGVPAVIDYAEGRTLLMPNLPGDWVRLPVAPLLSERLGCQVWLVNDARAFALAEASEGAGRGAACVACFTVGTGIGGGLVLDGKLHMGSKGRAGEFGHQTIDPNGPLCGCGNRGCLETLASGPAITAAGVRTMLQGMSSRIGELAGHDLTRVTPAVVAAAAEQGDRAAREILERAGEALGIGISNVITLFAPERVILGGGVFALGDWILDPARATIQKRSTIVPADEVPLLPAALGPYAGAIGAALWGR